MQLDLTVKDLLALSNLIEIVRSNGAVWSRVEKTLREDHSMNDPCAELAALDGRLLALINKAYEARNEV